MRQRVLLVDDDVEGSQKIEHALRFEGYDVVSVRSLDSGLALLAKQSFSGVVVEQCWEQDERTGLELCHFLRSRGNTTPVIVLARQGGLAEERRSFDSGADDWVAKPSSPANIGVRIRARVNGRSEMQTLVAGEFHLNLSNFVGRLGAREMCFTERETRFLAILLAEPGRIFSKDELIDKVWGVGYPGSDHAVTTIVKRIRKKLELEPKSPVCLVTVHGHGYRFNPPEAPVHLGKRNLSDRPEPYPLAASGH
jgi:DNA-binding response OmpR family regulator